MRAQHGRSPEPEDDADAAPVVPLPDHERQLAALADRLAHLASHDPLTGLVNRALLVEQAAGALDRASPGDRSTAVVLVDLDRFGDVNDVVGHLGGDAVLVEVASRLGALFACSDGVGSAPATIARLGGDEFLVVCEQVAGTAAATAIGDLITHALLAPVHVGERQVVVTASIGIVLAVPGRTDVDRHLLEAGAAMRHAKAHGRGTCEVYAEGMRRSTTRDAVLALQGAIERDELRLHYQPKVALDSDRIVGVEALLRWEHPDRGLVLPQEFIPLAEESGLIVPIGTWVLREACRQRTRWHQASPRRPPLVVSVNVSPRQFGLALVSAVAEALAESGAPATSLCLEVTEGLLMDDVEGAIVTLDQLAGLGVGLSVDDFGTGYSSFSYLRRLPLHELKIDRSFVEGLGHDGNDTVIVAAIVAMAHALDLRVVAEGVETADQLARLRALGCEEAQGYHLARPGPPEGITTLLLAEAEEGFRTHVQDPAEVVDLRGPVRTPTVLVVDDHEDLRALARMSLTAVGFDVHEAADGASAIAMARRLVPDAVVLDVVMPGVDGIEVCRCLRADPVTAAVTIVVVTGNAEAGDKVRAFSAGADDYIVKPYAPRDLTSRLRAALRRRSDEGAASRLSAP